jgi:hypothetical protein
MEKKKTILVEMTLEKEQNDYMSTRGWVKLETPQMLKGSVKEFGTYVQIFDEAMIREISEGFGIEVQLTGRKKEINIP